MQHSTELINVSGCFAKDNRRTYHSSVHFHTCKRSGIKQNRQKARKVSFKNGKQDNENDIYDLNVKKVKILLDENYIS